MLKFNTRTWQIMQTFHTEAAVVARTIIIHHVLRYFKGKVQPLQRNVHNSFTGTFTKKRFTALTSMNNNNCSSKQGAEL